MMYEREKSDPAVVAVKPVNNAERSAAESVEPRAGAEGNASQQSTGRAQKRATVTQALERIRQVRRHSPKVGAVCGKAARTDLCGGALRNERPYRDRRFAPRNDVESVLCVVGLSPAVHHNKSSSPGTDAQPARRARADDRLSRRCLG